MNNYLFLCSLNRVEIINSFVYLNVEKARYSLWVESLFIPGVIVHLNIF